MRTIAALGLVLGALIPASAHALPPSTVAVGHVREPMVTMIGQAGAYLFTSDRPRVLGQGTYEGMALDVWVPPGSSTLTTVPGAALDRRIVPAAMTLASPEFEDGATIPSRFSCDGDTTGSPALSWGALPEGTAELAIVVEDPDTPFGTFVHWIMYGIDPSLGGLAEGERPAGSRIGSPWRGPCPPNGDPVHRYIFTLYAISEPTELDAGANTAALRATIRATLLDQARLTGMYAR